MGQTQQIVVDIAEGYCSQSLFRKSVELLRYQRSVTSALLYLNFLVYKLDFISHMIDLHLPINPSLTGIHIS